MGKRSDERYKLLASTFGSTAVGTALIGFIRPELEHRNSPDPATIYDPYYSLGVAIVLLLLAPGWLGGRNGGFVMDFLRLHISVVIPAIIAALGALALAIDILVGRPRRRAAT